MRIALGLLTRIPVGHGVSDADTVELGRSVLFYPLVGVVIGLALAGVAWSMPARLDTGLQAALLLSVWVGLTGGMHLEGLADTADGWIGGMGNPSRALAILKDPHCGPFGVMALLLLLLLKWNGLRVVLESADWGVLLVAPLLGRAGIVVLFMTLPYARPGGMGEEAARAVPRSGGWSVCLVSIVSAVLLGCGWMVVGGWVVVLWRLRASWLDRFGGTTGDTAGAACELLETVVLTAWLL